MKSGIGKDHTRGDHPRVANQLYASYAHALEVRNLASIIGPEELSEADRSYLEFAEALEQRLLGQRQDEDRHIEETLNIAWEVLSQLPAEELTRVSETDLDNHYQRQEASEESS